MHHFIFHETNQVYLNFFSRIFEIVAPARSRACQEIFNEPDADVVAHSFQLLVDIFYVFKVLDQLSNQCSVSQREEFRILKRKATV